MVIAERRLKVTNGEGASDVTVRLHAPEAARTDWVCRYEIGWPEGPIERYGMGIDAVQALLIALQMIGAELYTSDHHNAGRLQWLAPGGGYGFPVANVIRDLLVGDDRGGV
jgi:hypothetical protein